MQVMTRGCPRCRGDLARVDDLGDTYYSCVQCGHVVYETYGHDARPPLAGRPRRGLAFAVEGRPAA